MSNKTYDILKWIAQIFLPAFITFYGVIACTWAFPYTEQMLTTMAGLDAFMGALLGISSANYKKGA